MLSPASSQLYAPEPPRLGLSLGRVLKKGEVMYKLIRVTLILSALLSCTALARAQGSGTTGQTQDRQAQEQAERDRKQAERDAKTKEKKGERKEPGTRCARWKQGKA